MFVLCRKYTETRGALRGQAVRESLKIVLLCGAAAILYGTIQDLVTTRICVEYFTIGHPPVWGGTWNPTVLALTWGFLATWWVGLFLGIPAAFLSRIGARPKLAWRDLLMPLAILMLVIGGCAIAAGALASIRVAPPPAGYVPLLGDEYPRETHHAFLVDLAAHQAAYMAGFAGGVVCLGWIWWQRGRMERAALREQLHQLREKSAELLAIVKAKPARP